MPIVIEVTDVEISTQVVWPWTFLLMIGTNKSPEPYQSDDSQHHHKKSNQPNADKEQTSDQCQLGNQKAPANE
ncbi:hypothetical protein D3C72_2531460 [compost metagenome]